MELKKITTKVRHFKGNEMNHVDAVKELFLDTKANVDKLIAKHGGLPGDLECIPTHNKESIYLEALIAYLNHLGQKEWLFKALNL